MLNNLMTHYLGQKKFCKILLQINSSYFSKMVLHNSKNKTRAFAKLLDILSTHEESRLEAAEYFNLKGLRYKYSIVT